MMDIDQYMTTQEAAAAASVQPSTWRSYVARGQAPAPATHVGSTPLWDTAQVRAWVAARPGQGARTDLRETVTYEVGDEVAYRSSTGDGSGRIIELPGDGPDLYAVRDGLGDVVMTYGREMRPLVRDERTGKPRLALPWGI